MESNSKPGQNIDPVQSLYRIWMLVDRIGKDPERFIHFSYYNHKPEKCLHYIKEFPKRKKFFYALLIDNRTKKLIEVWDRDYWRPYTDEELRLFNEKHIGT